MKILTKDSGCLFHFQFKYTPMFKKVLIAEDVDSMNIGVVKTLSDLQIQDVDFVKYCDDALLRIKKAVLDGEPYELLITDLSFQPDQRIVNITDGTGLIRAAKLAQPGLRIVVLSVEDRPFRIKSLFNDLQIDAYVAKGRKSMDELRLALQNVHSGKERFVSPQLSHILADRKFEEIEPYDEQLLKLLAEGLSQDQISARFREMGEAAKSTSSIEKRINRLKTSFNANNNVHLVVIAKDLGLI